MKVTDKIKEKFGTRIDITEKSSRRFFGAVAPSDAKEIVTYLFKILGARLSTISSVDSRAGIELLYHMTFDHEGLTVTVRTLVKKPELIIDSITPEIAGAEWIEREVSEMMGVNFKGHPNMQRLLLPDDWKEGEYPGRKKSFDSLAEGPLD
jgi:Ni,Fe-hydrogenase III component G